MAFRSVKIDEELLAMCGGEEAVNKLLALEQYREGEVSLGRAAELAGLSLAEFLEVMEEHRTYINYGAEELEEDRKTFRQL